LDADKEGFLRSETSLIQTVGRAARNVRGEVLMYADHITGSMKRAIEETDRRREKQVEYNKKHNITPKTIIREIKDILPTDAILDLELQAIPSSSSALEKLIRDKEKEMKEAAKELNFELAAILRDEIHTLHKKLRELGKSDTGVTVTRKNKDLPVSVRKVQAPIVIKEKKSAVKKNLGKTRKV
jgi:excinuclease ABC subunit B